MSNGGEGGTHPMTFLGPLMREVERIARDPAKPLAREAARDVLTFSSKSHRQMELERIAAVITNPATPEPTLVTALQMMRRILQAEIR